MKKILSLILLSLSIFLVSCSVDSYYEEEAKKENNNETSQAAEIENSTEVTDSLFAEGQLKDKAYSNIAAQIDYLDDGSYLLKVRIEQVDDIIFNNENQNIYAEVNISSDNLPNHGFYNHMEIDDPSLYPIALVDSQVPAFTEILIDKDSNLLTEEEHKAILEKENGLVISVIIRNPEGYVMQVSNTIFQDQ